MSQDFMDAEIFADFIIEAREHLETIEPNLLELEKCPDNLDLINEIFRPMHSLKGASGFLGLNRINQLAHRCENILDDIRHAKMTMTSSVMDIILASTDALRQMLDVLESSSTDEGVPIEDLIHEIDKLMESKGASSVSIPEVEETVEVQHASVVEQSSENVAQESSVSASVAETSQDSQAEAKPDGSSNGAVRMKKIDKSPKEWIAAFPLLPEYKLTAFGEGHLKDFIDESQDIVANLNDGLLSLEGEGTGQEDLINDLFRFFHNLKGNSGIIGYEQINLLTHEAETVLNNMRRGETKPSHELMDLLLFVVDIIEILILAIDAAKGTARPPETQEVLLQLKQALAGGPIMLPPSMYEAVVDSDDSSSKSDQAVEEQSSSDVKPPTVVAMGADDDDDMEIFRLTVAQQLEIIRAGMETLENDSSHMPSKDAIYRCLIAIKNASSFLDLQDIKLYCERTAGIVDSARSSDMDFSLLLDMLSQEIDIIREMIVKELNGANLELGDGKAQDVSTEAADAKADSQTQDQQSQVASEASQSVDTSKDSNKVVVEKVDSPVAEPASSAPVKSAPAASAPAESAPAKSVAESTDATAKPVPAKPAPAKPAAAPPKSAAAQAETNKPASSTIRVDHEKLDHLMNLIGELIINRNRYTLIARHLEEASTSVDISHVAQSLSETTYAMARISDDLQDTIMKVRMVPVASVFSRFPRLVRDLSRKSGKEVDLVLEGEETELDKSVVEVIGDPLVHLIRNSVDHGIEAQDDRIAAGKPVKGRVALRAFHKGNSVAIEIEDDGKGIDPDKMREVAIRKNIITPEDAKQLDDREAMELIFAPGFSSAETITDISGRGVGMDVVRTNIKNLKGSVNITSEIGKGTRFTLLLPLTLAIIDALMVNVADEMFAIPLDAVSEPTKIDAELLTDINGRKAITLRGEVLGIIELSEVLNLPPPAEAPDVLSVVVIHDNDRRLGVVVDSLLERQEVVIKPLGSYLGDLKGISGATIMGDGSVILILDPHEIYTISTSKAPIV